MPARQPSENDPLYKGLRRIEASLPASAYFDADRYRRELEAIWYRSWIAVGRSAELSQPLAYRTVRIGDQSILVLRDEKGVLRAFHNTCRHRGSELCAGEGGRLKSRLIVCPYHAWSYATDGSLVRVPSRALPAEFDKAEHGLYPVAVEDWRGFVFVNLDPQPASSVAQSFDEGSADLANWPLESLVTGHSYSKVIGCNWKIFWENFNECLHCPGVHRELSSLVPIYGRGIMTRHDDPDWALNADNDDPRHSGGLREGAETWSRDGKAHGPVFPGLSAAERKAGQTYATHLPSMFVVGHVDYVRWVRLRPVSPESTELVAEWLFAPDALERANAHLDNIVGFGTRVLDEDAAICEVNQRGLHALPHRAGVLMPEEYDILRFHAWVRSFVG